MRIPLSWLNDYVSLEGVTPKELADRLTFSGLEVEGIETIGSAYAGFVVAEVTAVRPHPNADKLRLVTVARGADAPLEVVCGAPNVEVGMKAALATIGVVLPSGLVIKAAKIRGVASSGMLCAEDELGLSDRHEGLFALPADAVAGAPLSTVLGPPETVLVVEVTPNRPDCLSLLGIAREVGALLGRPVKRPSVALAESRPAAADRIGVEIRDPVLCPRYIARLMTGVTVGESPEWMKKRLQLAGVRAISNIVDITNYVMLECGQPLHAFDLRRLHGERIVVRTAAEGEIMKTLDGVDRKLTPRNLVICDAQRPVALAGIMGGEESGIAGDTSEVLLESAYFKPECIRYTSKALGLTSESTYRFERGADVLGADWASRRAAALMAAHAGARVAAGEVDAFPTPPEKRHVTLRYDRARILLGVPVDPVAVEAIFKSLDLGIVITSNQLKTAVIENMVESKDVGRAPREEHSVTVEVPAFRVDLVQEADLIEEIARIQGLDAIPAPAPSARRVPGVTDKPVRARLEVSRQLAALGLNEIMNYSLTGDRLLNLFNSDGAERVRLPNPISADQVVLRPSLIPQLVETLGRNRSRQRSEAALFEAGRVYRLKADGGFLERDSVAIGLMGPVGRSGMGRTGAPEAEESFAWLKGVLEGLCRVLRVPPRQKGGLRLPNPVLEPAELPWAEPGMGARILLNGEVCGEAGILRQAIAREWRIIDPVAVAELDADKLAAHVFAVPASRPIAAYPSVERDVALIVAETVRHEDLVQAILKHAPPELRQVKLFDIYRGDHVGAGRKSMAYALTYQSREKTLTDEDANGYHNRIKAGLASDLQAEIRE
jgi:phenylalanyl-tRNA synthetase beta chain